MTLVEAAALLGADSPITVSTLRNAITRGEMAAIKLAGKIFVTKAALREAFKPRLHPKARTHAPPESIRATDLQRQMVESQARALAAVAAIRKIAAERKAKEKAERDAEIRPFVSNAN